LGLLREVEDYLEVVPTCHWDEARGKIVYLVGLEKKNVKENHEIMNKNEKNPELKSSRASGLNFERLANLGSSHVRLANIVLNLEISRGFARTWNWGGIHDGGELPHWAPHPATRGWPQRHRAPPLALPPAIGGRPWP
jgi:hypothetical protein